MSPAEAAVAALLDALGVDRGDPELRDTPARVEALWRENLIGGYGVDPAVILADRLPDPSGAIVTLTDLPIQGVCPHHLTPFFGVAHIAYEPNGAIVGLGVLERLVRALSRRLILQETLCGQVADALTEHLGARGAACAIEARHLCLILRGGEPHDARVCTRVGRGTLRDRSDILPPVGGRR